MKAFGIDEANMFTFWDVSFLNFGASLNLIFGLVYKIAMYTVFTQELL